MGLSLIAAERQNDRAFLFGKFLDGFALHSDLKGIVDRFDNTAAEAPLRDLIFATNAAAPEDGLA